MNGSTENRAPGAPEKPGGPDNVFSLTTARRMLPLVRQIVADILGRGQRLKRLHAEKDCLDRQRRTLAWPGRSRRYQLQDEIADEERGLQEAVAELDSLGLVLLDEDEGRVGFPTLVNERRAFFTWQPGEDGLKHWHFLGESIRRVIPPSWAKADGLRPGKV
ncbi:MAG TPA: DUF2203 family protein [Gemmataceae bacterium]|nr:DUF2203 family protein [Gemmataceae bacterium]